MGQKGSIPLLHGEIYIHQSHLQFPYRINFGGGGEEEGGNGSQW
jgi:hypothetical protein